MPHAAAVSNTSATWASRTFVMAVVISGTWSPRSAKTFCASGNSFRTFSGSTDPPGRTVKSTPSNPSDLIAFPAPATPSVWRCLMNIIHFMVHHPTESEGGPTENGGQRERRRVLNHELHEWTRMMQMLTLHSCPFVQFVVKSSLPPSSVFSVAPKFSCPTTVTTLPSENRFTK